MSTPPVGSTREGRQEPGQEPAREDPNGHGTAVLQPVQEGDLLQALQTLREEVEALRGRQDAYEPQLAELAGELAGAREFRERAEVELSSLQMSCAVLAAVLDEMAQLPADIRLAFEPELSEVRGELQRQLTAGEETVSNGATRIVEVEPAANGAAPTVEVEPAANGAAPTVEVEDAVAPEPVLAPPRELVFARLAPPAPEPAQRSRWLASAIEAIATRRSAGLAADLIAELLPLHASLWDGELAYELEIAQRGKLRVRIAAGSAAVTSGQGVEGASGAFRLRGEAAAFASLAGGGAKGRRPAGVRVRGSRRAARGLFAACARPVALTDLIDAGVIVWPGLLLAALAEAVDREWTRGMSFTVAYEIEGAPGAAFNVLVRDGAPISVVAAQPAGQRSQGAADGEGAAASAEPRSDATAARPDAVIRAGERAFLAMVAGVAPPEGESVLVAGEEAPALMLLGWFARAQGLVDAPAQGLVDAPAEH